jgi:tRNA (guanine37-N1)-methyltransferase
MSEPLPADSSMPATASLSSPLAPGLAGQAKVAIDFLSIFPQVIEDYCSQSIIGRARGEQLLQIRVFDLRSGATDAHRSVDDAPFGGGAGMVLAPEPTFRAVEQHGPHRPLYLLSPAGRRFDQRLAAELVAKGAFSLLCARYEGVDERIAHDLVDGEISLGDFVLAGGELAALAVAEAVCRLVPGVLGNEDSVLEESFANGLLEYPQ